MKNQFGRPKKKGRQNFRIFFENPQPSPPPLEKILDPPLIRIIIRIGISDNKYKPRRCIFVINQLLLKKGHLLLCVTSTLKSTITCQMGLVMTK